MTPNERKRRRAYIKARVKVDPATGCWVWQLYRDKYGYGWLGIATKSMHAHRLAYIAFKGTILEGMIVRHKCHNPPCCNPRHLLAGTYSDNFADNRCAGRKAANDKLMPAQVREIRHLLAQGTLLQREIAAQFNVSKGAIADINVHRTWKELS